MEQLIAKLDPFTGLLVLACVALYFDGRRDRARYQEQLEKITEIYQETLKSTTETLERLKAELAMLAQSIRRRTNED